MERFALLADASCALTKDLRDRFGAEGIISGNITFPDGHSEKTDIDWVKHTPEEYFGSMADKKVIYNTSAPNPDELRSLFVPFLEQGRDILMVVVSHALSGTYGFACKAAEALMKEFPERKIRVIDSLRYSTAEGMLLMVANDLREQGKSVDEVADYLEENKCRFHQIGIMDDLFFLSRTGRVNKAAAFMGSMVGVEPMADIDENGLSTVLGKGKGKKKSLKAAVRYMKALGEDFEHQTIFIAHSYRPKEAEFYKEEIEKELHPKEIIVSSVDMFCGANIGPGLVAAYFYGKKASPKLEEEKKILAECLSGK